MEARGQPQAHFLEIAHLVLGTESHQDLEPADEAWLADLVSSRESSCLGLPSRKLASTWQYARLSGWVLTIGLSLSCLQGKHFANSPALSLCPSRKRLGTLRNMDSFQRSSMPGCQCPPPNPTAAYSSFYHTHCPGERPSLLRKARRKCLHELAPTSPPWAIHCFLHTCSRTFF